LCSHLVLTSFHHLYVDDSLQVIAAIQQALRKNGLPPGLVRKVDVGRFFVTRDIGVLTIGLLRDVRPFVQLLHR
jgi:hypothetical protein